MICYTAHGNEGERDWMLETVSARMIQDLKKDPSVNILMFGTEDVPSGCVCPACKAEALKYGGSESAAQVKFCNELADIISAWMETEEGQEYKRDFYVMYIAYNYLLAPPARYNETTQQWEAIDESVIANERTIVQIAPAQFDYQLSVYSEGNNGHYNNMEGWKACSHNMSVYSYQTNYSHYLIPYDTFGPMQELYQYFATMNVIKMYDLGQGMQKSGGTGWLFFKNYLTAKLGWNVNLDINALTEKFFLRYFGPAADEMLSVFQSMHAQYQHMIQIGEMPLGYSIYSNISQAKLWPKNLVKSWSDTIEIALNKILYLQQTNKSLYQTYYDNICAERVSVNYMLVNFYESSFSAANVLEWKLQVREDCERVGITYVSESSRTTIDSFMTDWGL